MELFLGQRILDRGDQKGYFPGLQVGLWVAAGRARFLRREGERSAGEFPGLRVGFVVFGVWNAFGLGVDGRCCAGAGGVGLRAELQCAPAWGRCRRLAFAAGCTPAHPIHPTSPAHLGPPQLAYHDTTQAALGGMEPWEHTPLPPAPHSRHSSNLPAAWSGGAGPLAASGPAADPLAAALGAAAAEQQQRRLPLLEEEEAEGVAGTAAECSQQQDQQQQQAAAAQQAGEWEDRAHAVPGVAAVAHDGVLGVRQSLLDLEPLPPGYVPDDPSTSSSASGGGGGGASSSHQRSSSGGAGAAASAGLLHDSSEPAAAASHLGGKASAPPPEELAPAPPPAFDPLGAVPSPPPSAAGAFEQQQQQQGSAGELIDFGNDGSTTPPPAAPAESTVRSQLDDLLL